MNFKLSDFSRSGNGTLVAEASTIGFSFTERITIDGRKFIFRGTDTDASGEDVAGWRFTELTGKDFGENALIIND
jgi:hypothetical protein